MDSMDVDSPPDPGPLRPLDRVLRRLAQFGVPEDYLQMHYQGLVAFVRDNMVSIPEVVSAILPSDEEVAICLQESKGGPKKAVNPSMKNRFRECMVWLQWLMFSGDPIAALTRLSSMSSGRGVCGAVWGNNDIAYRCRTCEHDPTCAICVPCFKNGKHINHDYSIIYTGGGCCDCGDVTAWKREGFCSKHKGAEQIQPLPLEYANSVGPVLDVLLRLWKDKLGGAELSKGSDRSSVMKKVANELTFVVVELLLEFCKQSESLLSFVSKRIVSLFGLLEILVRAERFLSEGVARKLSELLLKLLGEPVFKYEFAKVFLGYYPVVVSESIKEGSDDAFKKFSLLSTFSVQIFTVPTLTPRLVKEMNLLAVLLGCLGDIFVHCSGEDGRLQTGKWGNLYETTIRVVEDIRFVMSRNVVPKYVTNEQREILKTWLKLLSFMQGMSPLKRETGAHIEEENEHVNLPFVLGHSIASIHSLLVDGVFSASEEAEEDIPSGFLKQDIDEGDGIRHAKVGRLSQESSVCCVVGGENSITASNVTETKLNSMHQLSVPSSVTWLTYECLKAIENCLGAENTSSLSPNTRNISTRNFLALKRTLSKIRRGKSIFGALTSSSEEHDSQFISHSYDGSRSSDMDSPKSMALELRAMVSGDTDSAGANDMLVEGDGSTELDALRVLSLCDWPPINYDVSSQEVSVHIPLHRLISLLLQKAMKKFYIDSTLWDTTNASTPNPSSTNFDYFFRPLLGGCHPHGFSAFIMEHPLRNRVFFAEVQAGMWRKNGDAPILYCEWYCSVRWAEQGLENDLFLLQCCAALAPADLLVSRIIERFGLLDYLSLNPQQSSESASFGAGNAQAYHTNCPRKEIFWVKSAENLRRELIHKLATGDATRSQLVKSLPHDLSKFDKLQEILDSVAVYSNPSGFNQGMYSLRWSCWKELDLYNARWNARDLQVAEERYMRCCNVSALATQLPRWTKIYPPLKCASGVATYKAVLQFVRAVLFYAVYTDKSTETRGPDGVLLNALHLLSLALDICFQKRDSADMPLHVGDSAPLIAFAVEEIHEGLHYMANGCSLLSLLVSLTKMRKRVTNSLEAGSCNLSPLIESLLKKFVELDAGCMIKLQQLPPEVVIHMSQLVSSNDANISGSSSDSEKRKAKARERQAAILAKMRAEQFKFLSSVNTNTDDDSKSELEESNSDDGEDVRETPEVVCSLCHDPNSKIPLSFLILLQKSKLLSFIDRGPLSWDQVRQADHDQMSASTSKASDQSVMIKSSGSLAVADQSGMHSSSGCLGVISSSQLAQIVQDTINDFACYAQPGEVDAIMDFVKVELPSLRNAHVPTSSVDLSDSTAPTFEKLEQDMYISIREGLHNNMLLYSNGLEKKHLDLASVKRYGESAVSAVLGKYIAALSRERTGNPENSHNDKAQVESTSNLSLCNGFKPADCDGVHLSSCGNAVHQGCLDRYLSSLKERFVRRIVFEEGHVVDPDQGEFMCPVCRRLANSVFPSLPGDFQRVWKQPLISKIVPSIAADPLAASSGEGSSLSLRQAFSLLQTAANMVGKGDTLKTSPLQRNERTMSNHDSICRVLSKLYFPNRQDKFTGSARLNHSMIMWDTLKYSLVSMEIAARCGRSSVTPTYGLNTMHKELKSSSGFTLSLLLKTVHYLRRKTSLHVLQRFRGIQLFADSICSGISEGHASSPYGGGGMSCILRHADKEVSYPDTQFWKQAGSPILAHDAFSSFMWVLYCLPCPFLSCAESLLCLMHIFYAVSVIQAIIAYWEKHHSEGISGLQECLITDISKVLVESEWIQQYFRSNHVDSSADIKDIIRKSTFPFLRRCALLWRLLSTSMSVPFCDREHRDGPSHAINDMMDGMNSDLVEHSEVQEVEKMFKIPLLDNILEDQELRSVVRRWLDHFLNDEAHSSQHSLRVIPAVPFKLMRLPHLYQDLLQRYIKQRCSDCKNVLEEPALCLLCGKLCSPNWKPCCRESGCQNHAMSCGAGTGVFLLIKRTTILLQRCARQAPWPSPYLDAFGEEAESLFLLVTLVDKVDFFLMLVGSLDFNSSNLTVKKAYSQDIEMHRGKPLYLNEERYAALSYMVASHGLDQSSKVLGQTTIGTFTFFLV